MLTQMRLGKYCNKPIQKDIGDHRESNKKQMGKVEQTKEFGIS